MNEARLAELIERYFERDLSLEEKHEFEAMLLAHDEARERFWEAAEWHALFRQWGEQENGRQAAIKEKDMASVMVRRPQAMARPRPQVVSLPRQVAQRGFPFRQVLAWAAVLVLSAVGVWFWQEREPMARVAETVGAESNGQAWKRGEVVRRGTVALTRGAVQFDFVNGARVVLQGPAELEIVGPKSVRLRRGRLTAEIPKSAHGFTVQTPNSTTVDLGTRFGVAVEGDAASETDVFEGKVEVSAGGQTLHIQQGAAALVSVGGLSRGRADASKFPPSVLVGAPRHHWHFIGSAGTPAPDGTQIPDIRSGATAVVRGVGAAFDATGDGIKLPGGLTQTQACIVLPGGVATGAFGRAGRFKSVTYECWATQSVRVQWVRLFDFNSREAGEASELDDAPRAENYLHFAMDAKGSLAPVLRRQTPGADVQVELAQASVLNRLSHYVVTYDAAARRWTCYQDGLLAASMADPDGVASLNDVSNRIGGGRFRFVWDGTIHDFRIYDHALTPEQVGANFQSGPSAR